MATYTTNLNLTKPDYTDAADVAVINTNMDTIDTAVTAKVPKAGGTMTGDLTYTNLIGANNGVSTSSKVDATNFRALYNSTLKARLFAESGGGLLYLYSQNNRLGYISRTSDDLMSFTVFDSDGNARTMSLDAANNKVLANDFTIPSVTSLRTLNDNMGTLREVPFAVAVSDWSGSGTFTANFTTAYVTSTSKEIVMFDSSLRTYGTADINTAKKSGGGGITFTTSKKPTGTITGTIFVFAAQDGKVPYIIENTVTPIANGGTGQSSLAGAQSALGITALSNQIGTLNSKLTTEDATVSWESVTGFTPLYGDLSRFGNVVTYRITFTASSSGIQGNGLKLGTIPSAFIPHANRTVDGLGGYNSDAFTTIGIRFKSNGDLVTSTGSGLVKGSCTFNGAYVL